MPAKKELSLVEAKQCIIESEEERTISEMIILTLRLSGNVNQTARW